MTTTISVINALEVIMIFLLKLNMKSVAAEEATKVR
jgi:hypothetical protein